MLVDTFKSYYISKSTVTKFTEYYRKFNNVFTVEIQFCDVIFYIESTPENEDELKGMFDKFKCKVTRG